MAESMRRRSLIIFDAWERLRARRNPGTAMAASKAMIATTIMISTRVKPPRFVLRFLVIGRPKRVVGHGREGGLGARIHFGQRIDGLGSISVTEDVETRSVQV